MRVRVRPDSAPFAKDPRTDSSGFFMRFMDYRKAYERHLDAKIPFDWDVHHLDENRNNNEMDNLVAIPKELHTLFHKYQYDVRSTESAYGFSREDIGNLKTDETFSFFDYSTGAYHDFWNGSEEDYVEGCYRENRKALFLDAIIPKLNLLNEVFGKIESYKMSQDLSVIMPPANTFVNL